MNGKIVSWKDEKGFGFIKPDDNSEEVFFHISGVKKASRKPAVGDAVVFQTSRDGQGRLKATHVLLESVPLARTGHSGRIKTEPVRKDLLDYFAYVLMVVLVLFPLGRFLSAGTLDYAGVPGVMFLGLLLFVAFRKKRPANKMFSCSNCRSVASHDDRTVLAWNRGFERLYCKACHQAWLRERPVPSKHGSGAYASGGSGCLGLFLIMALTPIICIAGVVSWL